MKAKDLEAKNVNDWLCFFGDDKDVPEIQYNAKEGKMINKWGTIEVKCQPIFPNDIVECVDAVLAMNEALHDFLR